MIQNHNNFTDDELLKAHSELQQLSKIAVHFNVPHVTVWRRAKKLGLEFSKKSSGIKIDLNEILEGLHPYYQTFKLKKRLLKENIFNNKCVCCGLTEWQKKPLNMQLDHIDGDNTNHKLENLRMICPNCHSQTDTYCGKNKGL
jgi:hypothetical protein